MCMVTSEVLNEILQFHLPLCLDIRTVHVCVEENNGKCQDEDRVRVLKLTDERWVAHTVSLTVKKRKSIVKNLFKKQTWHERLKDIPECLHQSLYFLSFSLNFNLSLELSQSVIQIHPWEIHLIQNTAKMKIIITIIYFQTDMCGFGLVCADLYSIRTVKQKTKKSSLLTPKHPCWTVFVGFPETPRSSAYLSLSSREWSVQCPQVCLTQTLSLSDTGSPSLVSWKIKRVRVKQRWDRDGHNLKLHSCKTMIN